VEITLLLGCSFESCVTLAQ